MTNLSQDRLKELLSYNRKTGVFRWRKKRRGIRADMIAGSEGPRGYVYIMVDGHHCLAHRLAWFYVTGRWPSDELDHRNLKKNDNRWRNLREADTSKNAANIRARNALGVKGVYERKGRNLRNPFQATLTVDQKFHHLGYFPTAKAAGAARLAASKQHFGEFAR